MGSTSFEEFKHNLKVVGQVSGRDSCVEQRDISGGRDPHPPPNLPTLSLPVCCSVNSMKEKLRSEIECQVCSCWT